MSRRNHFRLRHIVLEESKEVLVVCTSAITAMGIGVMVKKHFPGYSAKLISEDYYEKLKDNL